MTHDGGPAFPTHDSIDPGDGAAIQGVEGMSLRDYFAANAMRGHLGYEGMEGCDKKHIAGMAYELADAMLAARAALEVPHAE